MGAPNLQFRENKNEGQSSERPPLVSIIIPNRNYANHLSMAIRSCLDQSYGNIEIIVVDDASTDESHAILEGFGSLIKTFYLESQRGPGYARNVGMREATGKYIQFLDSDDLLHPYKIEKQVQMLELSRFEMCVSDWQYVVKLGKIKILFPIQRVPEVHHLLPETISDKRWFPVMAALFRADFLNDVGEWPTKSYAVEDRTYRLRILKKSPRVNVIREPHFFYVRHSDHSRSHNLIKFKTACLEADLDFAGELIPLFITHKHDQVAMTAIHSFVSGTINAASKVNEATANQVERFVKANFAGLSDMKIPIELRCERSSLICLGIRKMIRLPWRVAMLFANKTRPSREIMLWVESWARHAFNHMRLLMGMKSEKNW